MSDLTKIILNDAQKVAKRLDLRPLAGSDVSIVGASGIIGTYALAVLKAYGKCRRVNGVATKKPEAWRTKLANSWTITDVTSHSQAIVPLSDFILFGAGYGQPAKFMADPLKTIRINTEGLVSTFRSLSQEGRLLYLSSSEVYSGNPCPPYSETQVGVTAPQHQRACYIEAKRCGEAICGALGKQAVAARVALAYGPGTRPDDDRVINQFIKKAITEKGITMRDHGLVHRTYCYVADTVEMLFNIWLYGGQPVYNVGGTSSLTIFELANKISEMCKVSLFEPEGATDTSAPKDVSMKLDRYLNEFGKANFVGIDEGLLSTIKWQKLLYEGL